MNTTNKYHPYPILWLCVTGDVHPPATAGGEVACEGALAHLRGMAPQVVREWATHLTKDVGLWGYVEGPRALVEATEAAGAALSALPPDLEQLVLHSAGISARGRWTRAASEGAITLPGGETYVVDAGVLLPPVVLRVYVVTCAASRARAARPPSLWRGAVGVDLTPDMSPYSAAAWPQLPGPSGVLLGATSGELPLRLPAGERAGFVAVPAWAIPHRVDVHDGFNSDSEVYYQLAHDGPDVLYEWRAPIGKAVATARAMFMALACHVPPEVLQACAFGVSTCQDAVLPVQAAGEAEVWVRSGLGYKQTSLGEGKSAIYQPRGDAARFTAVYALRAWRWTALPYVLAAIRAAFARGHAVLLHVSTGWPAPYVPLCAVVATAERWFYTEPLPFALHGDLTRRIEPLYLPSCVRSSHSRAAPVYLGRPQIGGWLRDLTAEGVEPQPGPPPQSSNSRAAPVYPGRPQIAGWLRDLTAEGVESNPGPPPQRASTRGRAPAMPAAAMAGHSASAQLAQRIERLRAAGLSSAVEEAQYALATASAGAVSYTHTGSVDSQGPVVDPVIARSREMARDPTFDLGRRLALGVAAFPPVLFSTLDEARRALGRHCVEFAAVSCPETWYTLPPPADASDERRAIYMTLTYGLLRYIKTDAVGRSYVSAVEAVLTYNLSPVKTGSRSAFHITHVMPALPQWSDRAAVTRLFEAAGRLGASEASPVTVTPAELGVDIVVVRPNAAHTVAVQPCVSVPGLDAQVIAAIPPGDPFQAIAVAWAQRYNIMQCGPVGVQTRLESAVAPPDRPPAAPSLKVVELTLSAGVLPIDVARVGYNAIGYRGPRQLAQEMIADYRYNVTASPGPIQLAGRTKIQSLYDQQHIARVFSDKLFSHLPETWEEGMAKYDASVRELRDAVTALRTANPWLQVTQLKEKTDATKVVAAGALVPWPEGPGMNIDGGASAWPELPAAFASGARVVVTSVGKTRVYSVFSAAVRPFGEFFGRLAPPVHAAADAGSWHFGGMSPRGGAQILHELLMSAEPARPAVALGGDDSCLAVVDGGQRWMLALDFGNCDLTRTGERDAAHAHTRARIAAAVARAQELARSYGRDSTDDARAQQRLHQTAAYALELFAPLAEWQTGLLADGVKAVVHGKRTLDWDKIASGGPGLALSHEAANAWAVRETLRHLRADASTEPFPVRAAAAAAAAARITGYDLKLESVEPYPPPGEQWITSGTYMGQHLARVDGRVVGVLRLRSVCKLLLAGTAAGHPPPPLAAKVLAALANGAGLCESLAPTLQALWRLAWSERLSHDALVSGLRAVGLDVTPELECYVPLKIAEWPYPSRAAQVAFLSGTGQLVPRDGPPAVPLLASREAALPPAGAALGLATARQQTDTPKQRTAQAPATNMRLVRRSTLVVKPGVWDEVAAQLRERAFSTREAAHIVYTLLRYGPVALRRDLSRHPTDAELIVAAGVPLAPASEAFAELEFGMLLYRKALLSAPVTVGDDPQRMLNLQPSAERGLPAVQDRLDERMFRHGEPVPYKRHPRSRQFETVLELAADVLNAHTEEVRLAVALQPVRPRKPGQRAPPVDRQPDPVLAPKERRAFDAAAPPRRKRRHRVVRDVSAAAQQEQEQQALDERAAQRADDDALDAAYGFDDGDVAAPGLRATRGQRRRDRADRDEDVAKRRADEREFARFHTQVIERIYGAVLAGTDDGGARAKER